MYTPSHFRQDRTDAMHALMRSYPFAIVVTQRPQKIHENVLSQCDNLVLMRMNSIADLAHVAEVFSFVPPGLVDRATTFGLGEALVAGKIASHPALVRFGSRLSYEGGADVAGWA